MDGAESVRSGRSDRSERSHRSHGSHHHHHHRPRNQPNDTRPPLDRGQNRNSMKHLDRDDNRSVTIKTPGMSDNEERIEVQVIPQDDNWGDNTTAITGNTSETGFSMDDMHKFSKDFEDNAGFDCTRYVGSALAAILSLFGFVSPIAMVILPKLGIVDWKVRSDGSVVLPTGEDSMKCKPECEGLLISVSFKLIFLFVGTFALFLRQPKATMPRVFIFRAIVLFLVFVLTFAFWLFYGVRIFKEREQKYYSIVQFSVSLVDGLLFIHYLAIILLEIRQLQPQYVVNVTRSPDGESHSYTMGVFSIQRAAVWVLEQYLRDFQTYNPYLENATRRPAKLTGYKVYDVDGGQNQTNQQGRSRAVFAAAARRRDASHNDRFYEEQEYDRRVRKRRARLLVAAEEAFTHIKRMQDDHGPAIPMDPHEAAQAVFPSMARALQKYLRVTRQQPRYTMESVLDHLSVCIAHDMSPRSFVDRYLTQGCVAMNDKAYKATERWVLVCDQLLTREVEHGTLFQLRTAEISLMCTVRKIPHFSLTEEVIDPKSNKFVLRLNSETSV